MLQCAKRGIPCYIFTRESTHQTANTLATAKKQWGEGYSRNGIYNQERTLPNQQVRLHCLPVTSHCNKYFKVYAAIDSHNTENNPIPIDYIVSAYGCTHLKIYISVGSLCKLIYRLANDVTPVD